MRKRNLYRGQTVETLETRRLFNGLPTISIGDVVVTEGNTGSTSAAVVVSLSQPRPQQPVTVNYATQNGTAVAGEDYATASGKVTFAVGEMSKTILLPVTGDRSVEADEYFVVNLQGAKQGKIGDGQAIVTINDNEPRVSIVGVAADEGNSGTTSFSLSATLSCAYDQAVTVNYATQDGDAIAGTDYQAASGPVTFAAGETSATILIPVVGDRLPEADKYFYVNLSGASTNAAITGSQAFITIVDDEPRITIYGVGDYEGEPGAKDFIFSVNLSRAYDQDVTVSYATRDDSALAGADYLSAAGMLTFTPGQTSKLVTVQVLGNLTPEPDKYFVVGLSAASGNASMSNGDSAYGTILDDDGYYDTYYYDPGYYDYGGGYYDWSYWYNSNTGWGEYP